MNSYIVGQSGKSTLFIHKLMTVIDDGIFLLDPNGSLTDTFLDIIPFHRRADVILFDPSDADFPIAWNPLRSTDNPAILTSAMEAAIKDAAGYGDMATPTMSLYIRAALYPLIEAGEPLLGLPFFLTSPHYRSRILERVTDKLILSFWAEFDELSDKDKRQDILSTYNKAFAMILDTRLRHILGQPKTAFSLSDVSEGKILIARLPQGQLGLEQTKVLGHLMLSSFHLSENQGTHLFIYDAQHFHGTTLTDILANAPDNDLSVTLAEPSPNPSILQHVNDKYVFRISLKDIPNIVDSIAVGHKDLASLADGSYRVFPPDNARTLTTDTLPTYPTHKDIPRLIHENVRRNYTRPLKSVAQDVERFIDETQPTRRR